MAKNVVEIDEDLFIDLIYEIAVKGKDPELLLKFLVFKS